MFLAVAVWKTLGNKSEFLVGKPRSFTFDFGRVAIVRTESQFYAIDDCCSHAEVRLSDGWVDGECVACPWHGAQFDLATGKALSGPAILPVQTYPVEVEGDVVKMQLPESQPQSGDSSSGGAESVN